MRVAIQLALAGLASVAVAVAQEKPAFEAATIKIAAPDATMRNQMIRVSPNRISIPSMTLSWLIYTAYGEGMSTAIGLTGGPEWRNQTAYAIEAEAHEPSNQRQMRAMLRTLLEERFGLKIHMSTTTGDVYALVLARPDGKPGPKVKPWDGTCNGGRAPVEDDEAYPSCQSGMRPNGLFLEGATMFSAAELLSLPQTGRGLLGRIVVDRTGLTGRYKMELEYRFPVGRVDTAALPDNSQPSLSTAIQEQWGLKLEPAKEPFKQIVVDEARRPTEN